MVVTETWEGPNGTARTDYGVESADGAQVMLSTDEDTGQLVLVVDEMPSEDDSPNAYNIAYATLTVPEVQELLRLLTEWMKENGA
jgi:hypothetical protein